MIGDRRSLLRSENLVMTLKDGKSLRSVPPAALDISEMIRKNNIDLKNCEPGKLNLQPSLSFKSLVEVEAGNQGTGNETEGGEKNTLFNDFEFMFPATPVSKLNEAAVTLQKVYKSYRTRRNLADCAVVVEELWWKALDFAALEQSSVKFFNVGKPESAISRWARARTRAAKVGKGLSKNDKAQKLALQHWLEAIDPRHRYGHNLHLYYDVWFKCESPQPFFYWLDVGDGKEVNLEKCPRVDLQRQCIKYLGPKERGEYEVIVDNGKLVYKHTGALVDTDKGSKWIFVLSTTRALYVGQKKKGRFQHSSFLAGAAITAAGRLVAHQGILEAIWPYSGHYHPTEENFREFINFLEDNFVDLADVKRCATDDDCPPSEDNSISRSSSEKAIHKPEQSTNDEQKPQVPSYEEPIYNMAKQISRKWSTGAGPRIGCVRDYPTNLQFQALEHVNLSPRVANGPPANYGPIPSPRPSPRLLVSPKLAYMGLPSPRNLAVK